MNKIKNNFLKTNKDKLAIIGLGYVGLPLAVEFGEKRKVVGFDTKSLYGIRNLLKEFEIVQALLPIYRYLMTYLNHNEIGHNNIRFDINDYVIKDLNKKTILMSKKNSNSFKSRFELILQYVKKLGALPICVSQPHRRVIKKMELNMD